MSFGTPLAFALAALAIPIVIFYILKVRLRRMRVSTNLFWKQIYDEKPPRSIWQYLRHLLSLLAQLLLVALLVSAVADPYLPWQLLQARRIVAVIDNSASMRATDVKPSRFEAAIDATLATADGLRFRDEMAIVLAEPEPEVAVGMSGHVPTLKRALRSIKVSDNPTKLDPAIELGRQLIGDHPHGQVLVFTDGCGGRERKGEASEGSDPSPINDPPSPASHSFPNPNPSTLRFRIFGTSDAGNVGITQFQVRRSLIDPVGYEVLVGVKNASSHAVKGRLELELDGFPVDVLPLDLAPDGVFTRSLEKTSLDGGTLVAKLTQLGVADDAEDAKEPNSGDASNATEPNPQVNSLSSDDRAWAVLPPREIRKVLIVTPGNLFLQKVFEANPLVRITIQKEFPETWPTGGIVVLHRNIPNRLPSGNVFIVDPLNECDAWEVGELIENPIITEQDKDSPLMTHVRLDNVLVPEARQLKFAATPRVLAGSLSGDPVYAEARRGNGKCLVLSVNIDKGDLAFRTAFPIMVTNALGWFVGQTGELRQSLATGSMARIELADEDVRSADEFLLRSSSGDSQPLPVRRQSSAEPEAANAEEINADTTAMAADEGAYVSTPPLSECGVWSIVRGSPDKEAEPIAKLAVNLASDSETDLRTPAELIEEKPDALVASWFTRPMWFYLAAVACLLTVAEWWLYQRRLIV